MAYRRLVVSVIAVLALTACGGSAERVTWQTVHSWVGGLTSEGFVVVARLAGGTGDIDLNVGGTIEDTSTPDADGYVRLSVAGLRADTAYSWSLEDGGTPIENGAVSTAPTGAASFLTAFGHCLATTSSEAAYQAILDREPLQFLHLGDFHYSDISTTDPADHRAPLEARIEDLPALRALIKTVPTTYVRSDHDGGGGNNSDPGDYYVANQTAYKQVVPHHPLANQPTNAIYTAWTVGRVRFIQLDSRNMYRSPSANTDDATKTMLGTAQKAWFKTELRRPELLKVVLSDPPWVGNISEGVTEDKWPNYSTERAEIASFITSDDINTIWLVGDYHAVFFSSGANNPDGGFPVIGAGPLNQTGGASGQATYDFRLNAGVDGAQRYGLLDISDDGATLTATVSAYDANDDSLIHTNSWDFADATRPR